MKTDIHPEYHTDSTITCACGNKITIGSTKKNIDVEICSNCHPFYTGKEKLVDTAGRVEKFRTRQDKAKKHASTKKDKDQKDSGDGEAESEEVQAGGIRVLKE